MATTSFLYHTLALIGYQHLRTEYRGGAVYQHVELQEAKRTCRGCGARWHDLILDGAFERTFHALPIGSRRQFVVLHGHEQTCGKCGKRLREPISFADGKRHYIRALARYIVDLCRFATIKHVAGLLGVGWDLVKEIYKNSLKRRLKKRKLHKVRYIAVDEFAVQKGHRYMTVVLDLETGEILHAHRGKDAEALAPFLRRLRRRNINLQAVAIDMSDAYIKAVTQVLPDVDIVHDPFHVVALAQRAIDETRRDMYRELEGESRRALKGTRFLLLRGLENLKESALERLMQLMELNEPLYRAYLLKEELRTFWSMPNSEIGESFLDGWIAEARVTGLKHFATLASTLNKHRARLLTYFKHRISTGPLEGLNNKIKVLKRQAYGFRDMEYFQLRLYFLHDATPASPDEPFSPWSNALMQQFRVGRFRPVLSEVTAAEVMPAPSEVRDLHAEILALPSEFLAVTEEVLSLAAQYEAKSVLGVRFRNDMLHIAVASIADVDVLVSWNFRHIVRFDKIRLFSAVNLEFG